MTDPGRPSLVGQGCGVSLHNFTLIDGIPDIATYVQALEMFDAQAQLQELKSIAIDRTGVASGTGVLDVGCGFGLETMKLARHVLPGGFVGGVDKSTSFIEEARRRANAAGLDIDFRTGDAQGLPFEDARFDVTRAERLLIYLDDPMRAVAEMKRVTRPGGALSFIEPDFDTNTINIGNRDLTRRVLSHECDTGVVQGWVVRDLRGMLLDLGLVDIEIATRVVIFNPDLSLTYFTGLGRSAFDAGVIDDDELSFWTAQIASRHSEGRLFCTIGYYLFIARAAGK
jgi:SAM-dependent methyltransferase